MSTASDPEGSGARVRRVLSAEMTGLAGAVMLAVALSGPIYTAG